jgi:hypothetical protein
MMDADAVARKAQMDQAFDAEISKTASDAVRRDFNPSGSPVVAELKDLAAKFITLCEGLKPTAGREASIAITEMETAAMWAVKAATKGK